jgi:hypothetical protein
MEQGMFILLLGVVLGCVVASGIWAVLWTLIKGDKRLQKDRIDIMRNIAVVCAEIDGALAGHAGEDVQTSLSLLLEKIRRNLTVSMPLLDVYYVKYIESLIARYELSISSAEKTSTDIEKTATASLASHNPEKVAAVPHARQEYQDRVEDPGSIAATNFEVTQQYDFAKEKPGHEALDKRATVMTEPTETSSAAKEVTAKGVVADVKPTVQETQREDAGEVSIEDMLSTQKIELKEEKAKTLNQQNQDEHFISGEDVIDKLDSFFGFDNPQGG